MQNQTASRTALGAAYLRAAHQILDPAPHVLNDPAVLALLGPAAEKRIRDAADQYRTPEAMGLRAHVVLRSRYAEDRLRDAAARGIRQYVIVGAGFDTFALRQPAWAAPLNIFEIDHPDTQQLKQSKLSAAGISLPENVVLAGIDFEAESIEDGLMRHGIRNDVPTFFSWLGVTMYLTEPAIDATLRCMAGYPGGSEAVMTFHHAPAMPSRALQQLAEKVAEAGEPFVSSFSPEAFKGKLLEAGFGTVTFLTPQLSAPYFQGERNSLPNPERIGIVSARV